MLSDRLKELLSENKLTINEFAEMCDLPLDTVKNVYYGKTTDPKLSTVSKMSDALNLCMDCFVGKCLLSPEERSIIENFRSCGKHGRSIIELIARYEASAIKSERDKSKIHKIPCIYPHGDIHKGIVYDLCETNEIETSVDAAYIAIQITTNDLAPTYCKNDILLFENRFPNHGEMAAFFKVDRVYIRKFFEENKQYRLKCLHQHGEDIVLKRMDEIEYIGTCIGVVREG